MEVSPYVVDTNKFFFNHSLVPSQTTCSFSPSKVKVSDLSFNFSKVSCFVKQEKKGRSGFVVGCAKWGLEKELEGEIKLDENGEEKGKIGITRFREKCGEEKGVVELLECLEKEAIMGEDEGKEPMDYNRRAQIFDTSSKVFQSIKEVEDHGFSQHST